MPNWLQNTLKVLVFVLTALGGTTWINGQTGVTGLTDIQEKVQEQRAEATADAANPVEAPPTVTATVEVDGRDKNIPLSPSIFAAVLSAIALFVRLKKSP